MPVNPHIEALFNKHKRPGICSFDSKLVVGIEFHHTCYNPEKGLMLCHDCHNKAHFRKWQLTDYERRLLDNAPLRYA